jgi:hypothetical protein
MAFENVFGNIDFQAGNKMDLAKQQQFAQMLGMGMQAAQNREKMDLQRRQIESKEGQFNLKRTAETALMKRNMGMPTTPQEDAAISTMGQIAPPSYTTDVTGRVIQTPSGWGSVAGGVQHITPTIAPEGAIQEFPNGSPYDAQIDAMVQQPLPSPDGARLSIEDLEGFDPMKGAIPPQEVVSDDIGIDERYTKSPKTQQTLAEYEGKARIDNVFKGQELNKAAKASQKDYENKLDTLLSGYEGLIDEGAAVVTLPEDASVSDVLGNVAANLSSTGVGQAIAGAVGTKAQAHRDEIARTLPLMFGDLRKLVGMTGKELDTKKERDFYLRALTDPKTNAESNLNTIIELSERYGFGSAADKAKTLLGKLGEAEPPKGEWSIKKK